jgi:hypothetical protein
MHRPNINLRLAEGCGLAYELRRYRAPEPELAAGIRRVRCQEDRNSTGKLGQYGTCEDVICSRLVSESRGENGTLFDIAGRTTVASETRLRNVLPPFVWQLAST